MSLRIQSVLTSCILNSIIIVLVLHLAKNIKIQERTGITPIIIALFLLIIRMFFPVEFFFTYSIYIEDTLQPIIRALRYPVFGVFTVWQVLLAIWMAGAAIGITWYFFRYKKIMRFVRMHTFTAWEEIADRYGITVDAYVKKRKVRAVISKEITSPCVLGIRRNYILFPDAEYPPEDMQYILEHEVMHIRNHDMVWKCLVEVLCRVFWWNPVMYALKKELFSLIEMRNDRKIAEKLTDADVLQYMSALVHTAVRPQKEIEDCGLTFNSGGKESLKRRLLLLKDLQPVSKKWCILLTTLVMSLIAFSTSIIIEPFSVEKIDDGNGVTALPSNTWLVRKGNQYDVYVEGEYMETTDDLLGFERMKIYDSLEEAEKDWYKK